MSPGPGRKDRPSTLGVWSISRLSPILAPCPTEDAFGCRLETDIGMDGRFEPESG